MATLAGILDICAGASSLIGGAVLAFLAVASWSLPHNVNEPMPHWPFEMGFGLFFSLSIMLLGLGVLAVLGGIHVLRRSSWAWSIAGAIAATLACFPFGVAAIVLTVMSERELSMARSYE
jgi:hypothetical protein